jgi:hypothetical protein
MHGRRKENRPDPWKAQKDVHRRDNIAHFNYSYYYYYSYLNGGHAGYIKSEREGKSKENR